MNASTSLIFGPFVWSPARTPLLDSSVRGYFWKAHPTYLCRSPRWVTSLPTVTSHLPDQQMRQHSRSLTYPSGLPQQPEYDRSFCLYNAIDFGFDHTLHNLMKSGAGEHVDLITRVIGSWSHQLGRWSEPSSTCNALANDWDSDANLSLVGELGFLRVTIANDLSILTSCKKRSDSLKKVTMVAFDRTVRPCWSNIVTRVTIELHGVKGWRGSQYRRTFSRSR